MKPRVQHRFLITVLAGGIPLVVLAVSVALVNSFRPELPDPVAVHWGWNGHPDGYGSVDSGLWMLVLTVPVITLACWAVAFFAGRKVVVGRLAVAAAVWLSVFLCALEVRSLDLQRGLADARQAPDFGPVLLVALVVASGVALLASLLVPNDQHRAEPPRAG